MCDCWSLLSLISPSSSSVPPGKLVGNLGAPSFVLKVSCIMQAFAPLPRNHKKPKTPPFLVFSSHFHTTWELPYSAQKVSLCEQQMPSGYVWGIVNLDRGTAFWVGVHPVSSECPGESHWLSRPHAAFPQSLNSACGFHLSNEIKSYTRSRAPTTVLWTLRNPHILIMWNLSLILWYLWDACYMPSTWEYKGKPQNTCTFKALTILN